MRSAPTVALLIGLGSCSGGGHQIAIDPPPPPQTTGTLAGPLCEYDHCACRTGTEDAGLPEGNRKRFEVRLSSAQQLWLKLPNQVLYKNAEKPDACFYVDLAPGQHPVELRASDKNGVSAEVQIHELGTTTKSWYDTFRFECGNPGVCSFEELDALKATYAAVKRGLHDPCGSTRIKDLAWDHGKAPDGTHPSELVVQATLDIYKFAPSKAHGEACGEGTGRPSHGDGAVGSDEAPTSEAPASDAPAPAAPTH
jgi:hypothetical protein